MPYCPFNDSAPGAFGRLRRLPLRLLLSAGAVLWAPSAFAHAIVVRTSPAQGGVAAATIGKVEVWYDAGIRDAFVALAVVSAAGERVDKRDAAIDGSDPAHVSVGVNQLTPGKYTVRYRALSADGHIVSGSWDFEITP
jgi:methionine-rich copper-binding protein CopC